MFYFKYLLIKKLIIFIIHDYNKRNVLFEKNLKPN